MQTIVVGVDSESPSRTALDWVVERTGVVPARVRLVTVTPDGVFGGTRAQRDLDRAAKRMSDARPGIAAESRLVHGPGIAETLAAEAAGADLLVVGHHRRRVMRSMLAGALPAQIAAHAICPVVVVPHDWLRRFAKVVVGIAYDGSSDAALEFAAGEAAMSGRSLDIVHVDVAEHRPGSSIVMGPPDDPAARSPELTRAVDSARAGRPDLAVRTFTRTGDPNRILRAHGRQASLVVVGSHGRSAVDAVLHDRRAYNFMNWSTAPLCIVPAERTAANPEGAAR